MFGGMPVPLGHRTTGSPHGLPMVLLHGLGDSAAAWDAFARELGRHAIALDLRGHGTSPRPGEYTVDAMVAGVLAFLDDHALSRVDLVGHSMGGRVASQLAGRYPARVRRLVLEEAPVPPREGSPLPDVDPPARPEAPVDFDWAAVPAMRRAVRAVDPLWWRDIERLPVPTLWISGGPASHLPPERVAAAAAAMPDATVATIPAGHLVHTDAPDEFARVVIGFLSGSADGEPATP